MYFVYINQFNIVFVVQKLGRQNINPEIGYLKVAKRVICYLKDIIHFEFTYKNILKLID